MVWPARWYSDFSIYNQSQAQNRFYTGLEDWLSTTVYDHTADRVTATGGAGEMRNTIERLRAAVAEVGSSKTATAAMANLAEAVQSLVQEMRLEQETIRQWVDTQADQQDEIKRLLKIIAREDVIR